MYNIISIVANNSSGVCYHRQTIPHRYLEKLYPGEFKTTYVTDIANVPDEVLKDTHIVQFQSALTIDGNYEKEKERIKHISTVCDIDDYWQVPKHLGIYNMHVLKDIPTKIKRSINDSDCITTPCDILIDEIEEVNSNVHIEFIANAVDPELPQWQIHNTDSAMCRFGWSGGVTHLRDIELLKYSIKKLDSDKELRNKWQMVLAGFDTDEHMVYIDKQGRQKRVEMKPEDKVYTKMEKVFTDNYRSTLSYPKFTEQLKQYQKCDEVDMFPYRRLWSRGVNTYGSMYDEMDVVLVPLEDSLFNACKSNLKIVEAGFKKKAVIASDVLPYSIDLIKGENALLVDNKRSIDWYINMRKLINEPSLRRELGEAIYDTVKHEFHINTATKRRAELYKYLIENKNKA